MFSFMFFFTVNSDDIARLFQENLSIDYGFSADIKIKDLLYFVPCKLFSCRELY